MADTLTALINLQLTPSHVANLVSMQVTIVDGSMKAMGTRSNVIVGKLPKANVHLELMTTVAGISLAVFIVAA